MCADRQLPSIKHKLVLLGDQSVGKTSIINRFMYDYFDSAQYQATIGIDFFSKNLTIERNSAISSAASSSSAMHRTESSSPSEKINENNNNKNKNNNSPLMELSSDPYVVKLHLWDTAGQERYRSLIPSYVRNSAAAVVVYDVGNRASFLSAFTWVDEIKQALGITQTDEEEENNNNNNEKNNKNNKNEKKNNEKIKNTPSIVIMLVGNKLDLSQDGGREVSTEEAAQRAREHNFLFCEVSAKNGTNIKNLFRSVAQALPAPLPLLPQNEKINAQSSEFFSNAAGGGSGNGKFGAATRDPFLVTPSVMAAADQRQQTQQEQGGSGGGCC